MMFLIRNILRGRKLYALKIFSVNVFILILLLGSIELIFGKWKKNFLVNKPEVNYGNAYDFGYFRTFR